MSDHKNTILAAVLSGLILLGWQYFYTQHYPQTPQVAPSQTASATAVATPLAQAPKEEVKTSKENASSNFVLKTFTAENEKFKYDFQNDLTFKDAWAQNASDKFNFIVESESPLKIFVIRNNQVTSIPLEVTYDAQTKTFSGKNTELQINFVGNIDELGRFNFSLLSQTPSRFQIVFTSKNKTLDAGKMRQFLIYGNDVKRHSLADEIKEDGTYKWFGIDFHYHLFGLVMKDKIPFRATSNKDGVLTLETVNSSNDFSGYVIFAKKNYDDLKSFGDSLHLAVDFGFFAIVAVPILRGLQFFYKLVPNYGWAIIFLTLLIRTLMFPLQYKSFKSMKKMQAVQPEIAKLKEKYKADPVRLQKETMDLFKRAGANPLSGCLPLLAQLPIFFAFYQVLNSSVELVNAPFFGWLHDLSSKDPYYVLPLLMTIAMFIQQKMTPNTTIEPLQQKILLVMPLILGFIMKDLSSGLVLYIFVSTIYGIAQQLLVYKVQKD